MSFSIFKRSDSARFIRNICAATVILGSFGMAGTGQAAVVYDSTVNHSSNVGTAAGVLAGSLGTVFSSFSGGSAAGWTAMVAGLASNDVLLLGQSSNVSNANSADVAAFVNGGGTVIQLWGSDMSLANAITGNSFVYSYGGIPASIAQTANAVGTSFAGLSAPLPGLNDHGAITVASLGSAVSMYEESGLSHVAVQAVGSGAYAFVSWDFCCGHSPSELAEWDDVLYAAATYTAPVPLPAGLPLVMGGLATLAMLRRRQATKS